MARIADTEIERRRTDGQAVVEPPLGDPGSRRRFIELVGAAGGAVALSTLAAACGSGAEGGGRAEEQSGAPEPKNDLEIVNYALFLEYLEEDFYAQVVKSGELRSEYEKLARAVKGNESEHVELLESLAQQLAGTPVPRPDSNFGKVIAGGEQKILETAATLENLGAAAYLGQAPNITNTPLFEAALSIHTVEARHAAAFNEIAGNGFRKGPLAGSIPSGAFAEPMSREEVLEQAARFVKT